MADPIRGPTRGLDLTGAMRRTSVVCSHNEEKAMKACLTVVTALVATAAAVQDIMTIAASESVAPPAAMKRVIAPVANQLIPAAAAIQRVRSA